MKRKLSLKPNLRAKKRNRQARLWIMAVVLMTCSQRSILADEITYDSHNRRDPFAPLIGPDGVSRVSFDTHDFLIEGIIHDPTAESLVLINGEFYKEGETVGDAVVLQILKDRVILKQDGEEKTLWIVEETEKGGEP